jgi:CRISPR-associated endonuclease Cas3-HD
MSSHATPLRAKSPENGHLLLVDHLRHVAQAAEAIAKAQNVRITEELNNKLHTFEAVARAQMLDPALAYLGGLLHDIGKAHPEFQRRLTGKRSPADKPFRHELASLFFLPLVPQAHWEPLFEMLVAHHKSLARDAAGLGLYDLNEIGLNLPATHLDAPTQTWEEWSLPALALLAELGVAVRPISRAEALAVLTWCLDRTYKLVESPGVLGAGPTRLVSKARPDGLWRQQPAVSAFAQARRWPPAPHAGNGPDRRRQN